MARPMPLVAPVTIAVFPANVNMAVNAEALIYDTSFPPEPKDF